MSADLVERVRSRLAGSVQPAGAHRDVGAADAGRAGVGLDAAIRAESGAIVDEAVLESLHREVVAELDGAGPLEPLLALDGVTDVLVNGCDSVWIDRGAGLEAVHVRFTDDAAVRVLAQRLAASAGARLDDAQPFADAVLRDGTRLHAVLAPVAGRTVLSLRVLARRPKDLRGLVASGSMSDQLADTLRRIVRRRLAVVISGGTGAGKTTLLGALLGEASTAERLLLIEDAPELVVAHPHVVRLTARAPNVEGAGGIGLRQLVREALRMRPDRLMG